MRMKINYLYQIIENIDLSIDKIIFLSIT